MFAAATAAYRLRAGRVTVVNPKPGNRFVSWVTGINPNRGNRDIANSLAVRFNFAGGVILLAVVKNR